MKKLFALVLALAMVLTCAAALAEDYTVYLVTMDLEDMHWVSVNAGAEDAVAEAKEAGVDLRYVWVGPTTGKNDAAQIECINNAYADNADVILLASNGPDTEVATIEEYTADGVGFVYVDSPANTPALQTLATDNTAAGKLAGETLLAALTEAGITEGKVGIVNINTSTVSTQNRETGFRAAFEGTAFEILETQYGDGDAAKSQEIATNFITEGCVALFGANEGATVGVGNAIAAEGENSGIYGVGFDKSDAIMGLIEDGYILATMAQNPDVMGYEGVKAAVAALKGEKLGGAVTDTGVSVLKATSAPAAAAPAGRPPCRR